MKKYVFTSAVGALAFVAGIILAVYLGGLLGWLMTGVPE